MSHIIHVKFYVNYNAHFRPSITSVINLGAQVREVMGYDGEILCCRKIVSGVIIIVTTEVVEFW